MNGGRGQLTRVRRQQTRMEWHLRYCRRKPGLASSVSRPPCKVLSGQFIRVAGNATRNPEVVQNQKVSADQHMVSKVGKNHLTAVN